MRIFRDVKEIDEIPGPDTTGLSYSIPTVTFTPVGTKSSPTGPVLSLFGTLGAYLKH